MRLLWLADVLRAAGLTVRERAGWQERGADDFNPRGLICHATAGKLSPEKDMEILWVTGSETASAPISQLFLSRDGVFTVGASGRCNHVRVGKPGSPFEGLEDPFLLGIEAANSNTGEPWPDVQLDAYQRGAAAILAHTGWPIEHVIAHREHQNGKTDPDGIDMTAFRARVRNLREESMPLSDDDINKVATLTKQLILGDGGIQMALARIEAIVSARDPVPIGDGHANVMAQLLRAAVAPEESGGATDAAEDSSGGAN